MTPDVRRVEDGLQNATLRSNPVVLWGDLNKKSLWEKISLITKAGILKMEERLGSDLLMSAAEPSFDVKKLLDLLNGLSISLSTESWEQRYL